MAKKENTNGLKSWHFVLRFKDGREEEKTVQASTFQGAVLSLPRTPDVGRYDYTLLNK